MSKNTLDVYRKISKWTDDIKKDNKFYGVGTVNNQIHLAKGARIEKPSEDRAFSYEFKEEEIYAYGLLDGYNGSWSVDLVDQCILTNMYFDHLQTLQKKSDEEIFSILRAEFEKTEQTLQENLEDLLLKRASKTILNSELRKGTNEYIENIKEINHIDNQINSGCFALVALIIDKRLFVANVGTSHCFVCFYEKEKKEKKVVSLETEHTLANLEEMSRLLKLKANIDPALENVTNDESQTIKYTRCLGDFKLKLYYQEYDQFRDCTKPPLISKPDHPPRSLRIDDSYLFMVIYSDALAKIIQSTDLNDENIDGKIAKLLIDKIITENTLNSAAQSVLDEIKRSYDDKFSSVDSEREDLTLIVRVFDLNIKNRLISMENENENDLDTKKNDGVNFIESNLETFNENAYDSLQNSNESGHSSLTMSNILTQKSLINSTSEDKSREKNNFPNLSLIDDSGRVKPYVDFKEFFDLLDNDKNLFDEFDSSLISLADNNDTKKNSDESEETTRI